MAAVTTSLPLLTDAVDKVGDEQRAGNNRIQVPHSLNQCCAPDSYFESMLLTRPSNNVFRQHQPRADTSLRRTDASQVHVWSAFFFLIALSRALSHQPLPREL
jgi:hypothetical protein